jgi:hypothetical protein
VHIEHCEVSDFKSDLIESLQLGRAAMLYFVEMISINERANTASPEKRLPISVPSHHYIRGEDEGERQIRRTIPKTPLRNAKKRR